MDKKKFIKLINDELTYGKRIDEISKALNCEFFESDFVECGYKAFDALWLESFGPANADLINSWLFDREDHSVQIEDNGKVLTIKTVGELADAIFSNTKEKDPGISIESQPKDDPIPFNTLDDAIQYLTNLLSNGSGIPRR